MRAALLLSLAIALAGCRHAADAVREGPPVKTTFAPPPGLVQHEHFLQRREVRVDFEDGKKDEVLEMVGGTTEERYEPLPGGGFRVTSTVLDESLSRDGRFVPSPLSLERVPFVHTIDAKGAFVAAERVEETLAAVRERLTDPRVRKVLEPLLTAEVIAKRVERGWRARFEHACNTELAPGAVFYDADDQEIPVAGTARAVRRSKVLGSAESGARPVVELALEFAGRGSDLANAAERAGALASLEGGFGSLTEKIEGRGVRLVVPGTCQTLREDARVEGEIRLNREAARASGMSGFPERIRFDVHREVWRTLPGEDRRAAR